MDNMSDDGLSVSPSEMAYQRLNEEELFAKTGENLREGMDDPMGVDMDMPMAGQNNDGPPPAKQLRMAQLGSSGLRNQAPNPSAAMPPPNHSNVQKNGSVQPVLPDIQWKLYPVSGIAVPLPYDLRRAPALPNGSADGTTDSSPRESNSTNSANSVEAVDHPGNGENENANPSPNIPALESPQSPPQNGGRFFFAHAQHSGSRRNSVGDHRPQLQQQQNVSRARPLMSAAIPKPSPMVTTPAAAPVQIPIGNGAAAAGFGEERNALGANNALRSRPRPSPTVTAAMPPPTSIRRMSSGNGAAAAGFGEERTALRTNNNVLRSNPRNNVRPTGNQHGHGHGNNHQQNHHERNSNAQRRQSGNGLTSRAVGTGQRRSPSTGPGHNRRIVRTLSNETVFDERSHGNRRPAHSGNRNNWNRDQQNRRPVASPPAVAGPVFTPPAQNGSANRAKPFVRPGQRRSGGFDGNRAEGHPAGRNNHNHRNINNQFNKRPAPRRF